MPWLDALLAATAFAVALALRPWRALPRAGLPWPWLAWSAALPLTWTADRLSSAPLAPPLSGSCLLMLMAGWPLAVLGLAPVALLAAWLGDLTADQALQRLVWLGIVPATFALALGAAIRRWLPHHLFVYILGRGFFATALAGMAAAGIALALGSGAAPAAAARPDASELMLARGLVAWGDAFLTGMLVAIFVALRPHWLATYADRIYLPARPHYSNRRTMAPARRRSSTRAVARAARIGAWLGVPGMQTSAPSRKAATPSAATASAAPITMGGGRCSSRLPRCAAPVWP